MKTIQCNFCDKIIDVLEYDFVRWIKGELVLCRECRNDFEGGVTKTRRV